jgi:hypothetical protein
MILLFSVVVFFDCNSNSTSPNGKDSTEKSIDTLKLKTELDSIFELDQKYRTQMSTVASEFGWDSKEYYTLWSKQDSIDRSNLDRVVEIIRDIDGYPGKSLVGYNASKTVFFVLQHAPDSIQEKYYPLIVDAAKNNELKKSLAAMYQDRFLMHSGKPQIFGTQVRTDYETDTVTGAITEKTYLWPIADTTRIDSLRLWNGLGNLEEYLSNFGISRWE